MIRIVCQRHPTGRYISTLFLVCILAAPTNAYIDTSNQVARHTLPFLLAHHKYVMVLRVERINEARGAVLLKVDEWIKGNGKTAALKYNYGPAGAKKKDLLKQLPIGQQIICFCNYLPDDHSTKSDKGKTVPYTLPRGANSRSAEREWEIALAYQDGAWTLFSVSPDDPSWWNYWRLLPDLKCCFAGTPGELYEALKCLGRGESVVVRCQSEKGKPQMRSFRYRPNRSSRIPVLPLTPAAETLRKIQPHDAKALDRVLAGLKDKASAVRMTAADLLEKVQVPAQAAVPRLIAMLADTESCVREAAAEALGRFVAQAKEVVPALALALKDDNRFVRDAVAASLGRIGADAQPALPALIEALIAEGEKHERDYTLAPEGYAAVVIAMRDAVGKIDPTGEMVGTVCAKHLRASDRRHRYYAVWSVQIIGPPARRTVTDLADLYQEERKGKDKGFRWHLIHALCAIGGPTGLKEAIPTLQKAVQDKEESPATRSVARETLARWNIQESKTTSRE